jgi:hypothetical protein
MTNVATKTSPMPVVGEEIEVGKPLTKGIIKQVLPDGTVVIRDGAVLRFVKLNDRGFYEETNEPWGSAEYVAMRRSALMPTINEKVMLSVTTYIGCDGSGGEWGVLGLTGIVKAIDALGRCKIQIDSFELLTGPDYWINVKKRGNVDHNLGLYQEGHQIN